MYLWRTRELAAELRAGAVSEREKFWYFLILLLLLAFVEQLEFLGSLEVEEVTSAMVVESLGLSALMVVGVAWCYRSNRRGDDQAFLERFVCLAVPTLIQVAAVAVALMVILMSALGLWETDLYETPYAWWFVGLDLLIVGFFYWRVNGLVRLVAQGVEDSSLRQPGD